MRPWPGDRHLREGNSHLPDGNSRRRCSNSYWPEGNSQGPEDARVPSLMRNPLEPEP